MAKLPIRTRQEFFEVLEETRTEAERLAASAPGFRAFEVILEQLEAMQGWTAGGRAPTDEERESINIGLIAVRDLDPEPDAAMADFIQRLHELNGYFAEWPADS